MNQPEVIQNYNVYKDGERLIGISDEISMPTFDTVTSTMTGAGMLGEIENPVAGHFKSIEIEVPFHCYEKKMFELMSVGTVLNLTIRGSQQNTETETGVENFVPVRCIMKGKFKSFSAGKMKLAEGIDAKIKLELWYIKYEYDNQVMLELDKFNSKYVVCGKDMLAEVNKMC